MNDFLHLSDLQKNSSYITMKYKISTILSFRLLFSLSSVRPSATFPPDRTPSKSLVVRSLGLEVSQAGQLNHLNIDNGKFDGYTGAGTKADLDNHGNQLNPNNKEFGGGQSI